MQSFESIEWNVLLKTDNGNVFTLGVYAPSFGSARTRAKKLSQGCQVLAVAEMKQKADV